MEIPKEVLVAIQQTFDTGAAKGYAPDTWADESIMSHLSKCLGHIAKWLRGSREERHLEHGLWRLAIAVTLMARYKSETGFDLEPALMKMVLPK